MILSYKVRVLAIILTIVGLDSCSLADELEQSRECRARNLGGDDHIVCECTIDYCDNLVFQWPENEQIVLQVQSSKAGKRFHQYQYNVSEYSNEIMELPVDYTVKINDGLRFQKILGWGGAFTDASVMNLNKLNGTLNHTLLLSYFGATGLQYSYGRVPISGTDFSARKYSYDDTDNNEPDYELKQWRLAPEDKELKIPYIKQAMNLVESRKDKLKLFASSWSPPAWMKTSKSLVRGELLGPSTVNGTTYRTYAKYLMMFLESYKLAGIDMWGMTLQNEPYASMLPVYFFNSLIMKSCDQRNFIKFHLGPMLENKGYTKDKFKLIIGDDSLGLVNRAIYKVMSDTEAKKYVSGIGFHWYLSNFMTYSYIDQIYKKYTKDIEFIISTESCTGFKPLYMHATDPGSWERGVSYAQDIIQDLSRNVNAWIDWNLVLDMSGGPNWAGNKVDSPILVDIGNERFLKNPMYYTLGHFTRFLVPGSQRIDLEFDRAGINIFDSPKYVAAITPTNHIILVFLNENSKNKTLQLNLDSNRSSLVHLEANSISSFIYKI